MFPLWYLLVIENSGNQNRGNRGTPVPFKGPPIKRSLRSLLRSLVVKLSIDNIFIERLDFRNTLFFPLERFYLAI